MNIKKIIQISLQNEQDLEKALEFNKKNNYEYIIEVYNNLVQLGQVLRLLDNGYTYISSLNAQYIQFEYKEEIKWD